jgi:uncharacterized protein (DUF2267 family)
MANERPDPVTEQRRLQRRESRASQTWHRFLADLCAATGLDPEPAADSAVSVLCRLEERLTAEEARDLEAQLPVKLRQLLADACGQVDALHKLHRRQFVTGVALDLGIPDAEAESLVRAVFATVRNHISEGEARDIQSQLPKDLQPLWMQPT